MTRKHQERILFEHELDKEAISLTSDVIEQIYSYNDSIKGTVLSLIPDRIKKGNYHLKAHQFIGNFSIGNRRIMILPKISKEIDSNLAVTDEDLQYEIDDTNRIAIKKEIIAKITNMFLIAYKIDPKILDLVETEQKMDDFFESMAFILLYYMESEIRKGFYSNYQPAARNLRMIKGKINFSKYVSNFLVKPYEIPCEFTEFTKNNPINKILGLTLNNLNKMTTNPKLKTLIYRLSVYFSEIELQPNLSFQTLLNQITYNRLNERFHRIIDICELFNRGGTPTIEDTGNITKFRGFVFDMNELYERFIAGVFFSPEFQTAFNREFPQLELIYQYDEKFLAINNRKDYFRLKPDFLIRDKNENDKYRLIIDTKYKILNENALHYNISQDNVYQMLAYSFKFNCNVVLLYPQNFDKNLILESNKFEITGKENVTINIYIELIEFLKAIEHKKKRAEDGLIKTHEEDFINPNFISDLLKIIKNHLD